MMFGASAVGLFGIPYYSLPLAVSSGGIYPLYGFTGFVYLVVF